MTTYSDSSVWSTRQRKLSDTNLFAVTGDIIIEAKDADEALQKLHTHILKGQQFKWAGTTLIPSILEDNNA